MIGGDKAREKLKKIGTALNKKMSIYVGVPKGSPRYTYSGGEKNRGTTSADDRTTAGKTLPPTVAEVAFWNEFGTSSGHIPERSFLRATAMKNNKEYVAFEAKVVKGVLRGTHDLRQGLNQVGAKARGDVQKAIFEFKNPANAQATIQRKGFDAPLRDTSLLAQTISWEVKDE